MNATAERAARLGVAVFMFGVVDEAPRDAMDATWPSLYPEEIDAFRSMSPEDLALANAALEAEAELRDREWDALERLLALLPGGDSDTDALFALPDPEFRSASSALYSLGWLEIA